MSPWLVAVGAGLGFAFLQYGWQRAHRGALSMVAALLRGAAIALIVALLFDAPIGRPRPVSTWAALDVSESMARGGEALWRAALDSLRVIRPESTIWFGDSARVGRGDAAAGDRRSALRAAADRAVASGHPLVVITDGELSDADAASALPAGSRFAIPPRGAQRDVAIAAFEFPRAVVAGDTAVARVGLIAGATGAAGGVIGVFVDGREIARAPFDELPAQGTRSLELRVPVIGAAGPAVAQAVASSAGDPVAQNDTLTLAFDRSRSASAVFVTTAPDFDSRAAMGLLRGALALPARGFLRVAPGVWRVDGSLSPIGEQEVRAAFRDAPIAIIHGDTGVFGAPRNATAAPYALIVPVADTSTEWYVSTQPLSPLTEAFAGTPWDSLPPLLTGGDVPNGGWSAMTVSAGRAGQARPIVVGSDSPRRAVTVVASGFWRWQFRGGTSADAFAAFWGGIFDWLAGERADKRAAIPDASFFRAGESIRWRRGSASDSIVAVQLRERKAGGRVDSLTLRFARGASVVESPALEQGVYEVIVRGGSAMLAVNRSSEWLPRPVRVRSGALRTGFPVGEQPRLRDYLWIYGMIVGALCGEWLLRRRIGLR